MHHCEHSTVRNKDKEKGSEGGEDNECVTVNAEL